MSAGLLNCTSLEQLDLSENNVEDVGAEHIARSLASATRLCILDLAMNFIGPEGARHVQEMLMRNGRLTKLDLQVPALVHKYMRMHGFWFSMWRCMCVEIGAVCTVACIKYLILISLLLENSACMCTAINIYMCKYADIS